MIEHCPTCTCVSEVTNPVEIGEYIPTFRSDGAWIPLCPDHGQLTLRGEDDHRIFICHVRHCGRRFDRDKEIKRGTPLQCECVKYYGHHSPGASLNDKCECGHPRALHQTYGCPVHRKPNEVKEFAFPRVSVF